MPKKKSLGKKRSGSLKPKERKSMKQFVKEAREKLAEAEKKLAEWKSKRRVRKAPPAKTPKNP